jgi:perosamine synthetase
MKIREHPVGTMFDEREIDAVRRVLQSGDALTRGKDVELFEQEFAKYIGCKHAISTSSCGGALNIINKCLNLMPYEEVIVQANVFWVTIVNLLERGVKIKVADIDPFTLNIDPNCIEPLITEQTKAILIMHWGGNPADLAPIYDIASQHNLVVIEDAAHAVGADYQGKKIGSESDIACFSFSTLKNMSTLGEGGMIVTNDNEFAYLADKYRTNWPIGARVKVDRESLGEYFKPESIAFQHAGDAWDYDWLGVSEYGSTYRLSTPQAAVGRVQLQKLDIHNNIRENIRQYYDKHLESIDGIRTLHTIWGCKSSNHLYSFFVDDEKIDRDKLVKALDEAYDIQIFNRFWPIHLGGIMRMCGHTLGEAPVCERVWFKKQVSLPIYPHMTDGELEYIVSSIAEAVKHVRK